MGKMNVVIVGVCCFAVGIGVALGIAAIESETVLELKQSRAEIATENEELQRKLVKATGDGSWSDWGALEYLPKNFGPTSPFPDFLARLEDGSARWPIDTLGVSPSSNRGVIEPRIELGLRVEGVLFLGSVPRVVES